MTNITPYNGLSGTPSPNGTWTQLSGSSSLTMPPTYNGSMTLDSSIHNYGIYILQYEVASTCDSSTLSTYLEIDFSQNYPAYNDECASPATMIFPYPNSPFGSGIGANAEDTRCNCPGICATSSANPEWANPGGDVWFSIPFDPNNVPSGVNMISLQIEVTGNPYGVDGIQQPKMAIYEGGCGTPLITLQQSNTDTLIYNYMPDWTTANLFYFRIGSELGNEGLFRILFTPIYN